MNKKLLRIIMLILFPFLVVICIWPMFPIGTDCMYINTPLQGEKYCGFPFTDVRSYVAPGGTRALADFSTGHDFNTLGLIGDILVWSLPIASWFYFFIKLGKSTPTERGQGTH